MSLIDSDSEIIVGDYCFYNTAISKERSLGTLMDLKILEYAQEKMLSPGQKRLQQLEREEEALLGQLKNLQEDGGAINIDGTERKIPTSPKEELDFLLQEEEKLQKALNAFNEVETYLSLEEKLLEQESYLKDIVLDNKKLLELTKISYEVGKTEYLDISQINNRLISSQISLIDISSKRIFNRINLHLSLGGGFESK